MKLSVIVPYRNRESHKEKFIVFMENYFIQNNVNAEITIVEQNDKKPFNRGKLLNIGYNLMKEKSDYFCFHDIDMLPIEADYSICKTPTHLAYKVEQFNYSLPYYEYFGGVVLFDKDSFEKINGFSNEFWGWGAEDDDLLSRCKKENIIISRRNCRFNSLYHTPNGDTNGGKASEETIKNRQRFSELQRTPYSYKEEGLNSLKYEIESSRQDNFNLFKVNI